MSFRDYLRLPTAFARQWVGGARVPARPVLDLVDFGKRRCTVLDVGANVGGFAGNVLLRAPMATVHCFEPNAELEGRLRDNAARYGKLGNRPRCVVKMTGVGEVDAQRELIVTGLHAASSFLNVTETLRQGWPTTDFNEKRRELVEMVTLEGYLERERIDRVKLLKLDVQGYELGVLKGCGGRLRQMEYILAEIQFRQLYDGAPLWHEIVYFVREFGFQPIVMDGFCFAPDGQPLQADILLRNAEHG
jgi:FkbM family methyltransferase